MANRYGEAALMAVRMQTYGKALSPLERWNEAVRKVYPTSTIAQRKSGPRYAFLGLCHQGLVTGIEADPEHSSNVNGTYAIKAAEILRAGSRRSVTELWAEVTDGENLPHASQMDVVLALWKNGLIRGAK